MIVNNFVVSYAAMAVISLGLCLPAAWAAWGAAAKWGSGIAIEDRDELEKKVYLVISLLVLGFSLRLFMIPLWFLTLQSLIPSVPGAMCMAGVHLLASPGSFIATGMKFFIPLVYIYWLILNSVDRRIESQPFMKMKLMSVAPLAGMMVIESFFDSGFLRSVKPRIVSCCTSLFDAPQQEVIKLVRQASPAWIYAFYIFLAVCLVSFILRNRPRYPVKPVAAAGSLLALFFLALFLHTRVSPVMLEAPFHQCIFCLWQGAPDIAIASAALIAGLWLIFVIVMIPDIRAFSRASAFLEKLAGWALGLSVPAALWITARYAVKYFSSYEI